MLAGSRSYGVGRQWIGVELWVNLFTMQIKHSPTRWRAGGSAAFSVLSESWLRPKDDRASSKSSDPPTATPESLYRITAISPEPGRGRNPRRMTCLQTQIEHFPGNVKTSSQIQTFLLLVILFLHFSIPYKGKWTNLEILTRKTNNLSHTLSSSHHFLSTFPYCRLFSSIIFQQQQSSWVWIFSASVS